MQKILKELIKKLGDDPKREGLIKTPERVEKSLKLLTSGYSIDVKKVLRESIFIERYDEMVILKDIDIFSLCEHHLLPFFGKCHVGYIPNKRIVGLSKLARVVEAFSRRLQVQERMTFEIAEAIRDELTPLGVGVVVEATHLCMIMRGIGGNNSRAVTSAMFGVFKKREETRMEFMNLIKSGKV